MRWGYKTVQYELKKEGLLGGAFLDESEVEQSLNEFGLAGWELVSLVGLQDGLMAVFKQPLEKRQTTVAPEPQEEEPTAASAAAGHRFSLSRQERMEKDALAAAPKVLSREPRFLVTEEKEVCEEGVGSIRIE